MSQNSQTPGNRRSGFERRWIRSRYPETDRRKGHDRRTKKEPGHLSGLSRDLSRDELEYLLVSSLIQLEAVTRLLLSKGVIDREELSEMLKSVDREYQQPDNGPNDEKATP